MPSAILAPFKNFFIGSKNTAAEASGSSTCTVQNSNNQTLTVLQVQEMYQINYAGLPNTPTHDKAVLLEGTQIEEDNMQPEAQKALSGMTGSETAVSILKEGEPSTHPLSSHPKNGEIVRDHTSTPSRTIQLPIDARDIRNETLSKPRHPMLNDNVSGRSVASARTLRHSTDVSKDNRYILSKLKPENIRFTEPVEKHIKTYMTTRKQNFGKERQVICLWNPFSNIDFDSERQERHCIVGDVGKFNSSGGFDVMFNIFLTVEENHKMGYFPPITFRPFALLGTHQCRYPKEESRFFMSEDLYRLDKDELSDTTFSFWPEYDRRKTGPGSAILVAPTGCSVKRIDGHLIPFIRAYLAEQVESWYDHDSYPNEQHDNLTSGSLNLICTSYKSNVWAAAATGPRTFMKRHEWQSQCIYAKLTQNPDDEGVYTWKAHRLFKFNHGSSRQDVSDIEYTIAIEVYQLGLPTNRAQNKPRSSVQPHSNRRPLLSVFSLR